MYHPFPQELVDESRKASGQFSLVGISAASSLQCFDIAGWATGSELKVGRASDL